MRVIAAGHSYEMANVDGSGGQVVQFVRRRDDNANPLTDPEPGVLSQELTRVLIDRTLYLNSEDPCVEDVEIVHRLRDCLRLYESRAARRTIDKLPMPERSPACAICHHLLCGHSRPSSQIKHGGDR